MLRTKLGANTFFIRGNNRRIGNISNMELRHFDAYPSPSAVMMVENSEVEISMPCRARGGK
jgi:hypothetical protein